MSRQTKRVWVALRSRPGGSTVELANAAGLGLYDTTCVLTWLVRQGWARKKAGRIVQWYPR